MLYCIIIHTYTDMHVYVQNMHGKREQGIA